MLGHTREVDAEKHFLTMLEEVSAEEQAQADAPDACEKDLSVTAF